MDTYEKKYKEALERARKRISKEITQFLKQNNGWNREWLAWLEKQNSNIDNANKEYWRGYREGKQEILDKYAEFEKQDNIENSPLVKQFLLGHDIGEVLKEPNLKKLEKQGEHKPTIEMKTPEESLGIDSETYNKIIDECIYGENKPNDKVEPKFKVGDWVVISTSDGEKVVQIDSIEYFKSGEQRYITSEGRWFGNGAKTHLWTIQDEKAGDVLELDCGIGIFKDNCIDGYNIHCYCYYTYGCVLEINEDSLYDNYQSHPATKEQCNTLMKAMTDAGYTFDFEKKELKKIEQKSHRLISAEAKEAMYGNPAWSEEDEQHIDSLLKRLDGLCRNEFERTRFAIREDRDWLKSLKQRIGG